MTSGASRSAYRHLLRNRNYRVWFSSALLSGLGDWIGLVALQTLVAGLFADAGEARLQLFALSGIMMARLLPSLLVGPVAGVFADRYDRKRLMVFTHLGRGTIFVLIAFSGDLIALFTLTLLVEFLSLLFLSAKDASLPTIVDRRHLKEANQLNLLVTYGTLPAGASVATVMIWFAGLLEVIGLEDADPVIIALLLNATTFLLAGTLLSRLHLPRQERRAAPEERAGLVAELREGLRFIRELPVIRALITGVVGVAFGAGAFVSLGPAFVTQTLERVEADWFILMTSLGIGLVVGIGLAPAITKRLSSERAFAMGLVLVPIAALVTATQSNFTIVLGGGAVLGSMVGFSFVLGYTLLHTHTPDDLRGKTFAAFYTGTRLAMFAALAAAPLVAAVMVRGTLILGEVLITWSGIRITMTLAALVALVSAALAGRSLWRAASPVRRPIELLGRSEVRTDGVFVAFEGVEGSGKSTQVRTLAERLRAEGHDVLVTREPGGSPVAERVREVLLDPESEAMDDRTEALLYAGARAEHVRKVIRPALDEGKVVICDRFIDSSLVYQGIARGLGEDDVAEINRWAIEGLVPDAVVLLRLDPAEGLARAHARRVELEGTGSSADRLEQERLDFHRTVASGYLRLAKVHNRRFVVIDASSPHEVVARQVRTGLHRWLPLPELDETTDVAGEHVPDSAPSAAAGAHDEGNSAVEQERSAINADDRVPPHDEEPAATDERRP
ncbi:dTMP kinase [Egibacter rhizosphaerae]|uniref:dTMP kinase n=1 Tax=Egibacter rhizosphaerae TaxID=1670831 RepID=UPI0013F16C94|nr:dTMP kinase [Egibacter rhizosphaerae]